MFLSKRSLLSLMRSFEIDILQLLFEVQKLKYTTYLYLVKILLWNKQTIAALVMK